MPLADAFGKVVAAVTSPAFYAVLGVGVVTSLSVQGWQFQQFMAETTATDVAASVEVAPRPPKPRIQAREIAGWNLMGSADAADTETAQLSGDNLPETNLRFVLRGTFAAEDAETSSAIIETTGGEAKYFVVGDAVGSGATLHSVYGDHVVLARGGRLESLSFPEPDARATGGLQAHASAGQAQQYKREQMQRQLDEIRRKLKLREQGK